MQIKNPSEKMEKEIWLLPTYSFFGRTFLLALYFSTTSSEALIRF
jgi:hypothetical protein